MHDHPPVSSKQTIARNSPEYQILATSDRSGRDLRQGVPHGFERLLGFRTVRPAALGHIRPAATTLPAKRGDGRLDEIDGAYLAGEIVCNAHRDARAAVIDRDQSSDARSEPLLHLVNT